MTMQRRHYELIAEAIGELRDGNHPMRTWEVRQVAHRFSQKLARDNPNFNPSRFLKACGVEEGQ